MAFGAPVDDAPVGQAEAEPADETEPAGEAEPAAVADVAGTSAEFSDYNSLIADLRREAAGRREPSYSPPPPPAPRPPQPQGQPQYQQGRPDRGDRGGDRGDRGGFETRPYERLAISTQFGLAPIG